MNGERARHNTINVPRCREDTDPEWQESQTVCDERSSQHAERIQLKVATHKWGVETGCGNAWVGGGKALMGCRNAWMGCGNAWMGCSGWRVG
jgi:hypothetical protein